jgi:hypothetical protein
MPKMNHLTVHTPKKNGREQETKNKDQSPSKQKSPKEVSHTKVREPLSVKSVVLF